MTAPADGQYVNSATADPLTISATSTDAGSGVASVSFAQCSDASVDCATGVWSSLGTDTTSPYSAAWTLPADGNRTLRVVSTDSVGRATTVVRNVTVDRTAPAAAVNDPGANLRGTVSLTATATDTGGTGVNSVSFQGSPAGQATWTTISTDTTSPYDASVDTTGLTDGLYDFRVFVTDVAGNTQTAQVSGRRVDNTNPTVTLTSPGANVRGTVALTSSADDSGSGVATVTYQYSAAGQNTWQSTSALWNTTSLADGLYDLRATATDNAGNSAPSATVANVRVDNTAPSVTMGSPGANVRGLIALTSTSSDAGSGVATVTYQYSAAGQNTWQSTSALWDTTTLTDGLYDLHVVVTDNAGNSTVSATVANVRIDNTAPTVTVTNPGANVRGTVALGSTSSDGGSGISGVVYQYSPAGQGNWTTTPSAWNTVSLTDGLYDLRATATDNAGNSTTSATVTNVRIDNTPPTTTSNAPAGAQSADVIVTLTSVDSGSGVSTTQYKIDSGTFTTGTTVVISAPVSHTNDGVHTIQFQGTDNAGNVETLKSVNVTIDTTPPDGTAVDPGSTLRGTVTLTATATATDIASIAFQYRAGGSSGSWTTIGTDTSSPWEVPWSTTTVTDGSYDLRAVVTDTANNQSTSTLPTKVVDNTAPTGSITNPSAGARLTGSAIFSVSATDATSGVASVEFKLKPNGASTFTTIGSDSTSPYSSVLNTAGWPDGAAEIQAVVTDVAGNTTSTSARSITIDNSAPAVSISDPGANASGSLGLSAAAGSSATQVVFQRSPAGADAWTTFETDTSAPFTATLDTIPLADGLYDLRAQAIDATNNTGTSATRTIRIDNTAPSGSLTSPAAGETLDNDSTTLTANAADTGSGVNAVTFQFRVAGGGQYTDVQSDSNSPYAASWTPPLSGSFELRVKVADNAGNVFTGDPTLVTVSSGGTLTFADPGSPLSGTVSLSASSGSSTAKVIFQRSPAGAGSWTTIAEDTSSPWSTSFDTTALADGTYDLRAVSFNSANAQLRSAEHTGISIDNTRPRIVSSSPADGSIVSSASSIALTASEPIASVANAKLDGLTVALTISGTSITVNSGNLPSGPHVLEGLLVDNAGKRAHFRVAFTIPTSGSDAPYVEKNTSPDSSTTLSAVGGSASVTMPSGSYTAQPAGTDGNDWLVLRLDPILPPTSPGLGLSAAGPAIDVTAAWFVAGTGVTSFDRPLDILLANTSGGNVVPATFENNAWRVLDKLAIAGTLPSDWRDGYYVGGDGIHVLTRHLTKFALLIDSDAPSAPTNLAGTITSGSLTLNWTPGKDPNGAAVTTILYVNGVEFARYGSTVTSAGMGPFTGDDTRTFAIAAVDSAGNVSPKTAPVLGVPAVYGKTIAEATALLTARGLVAGNVTTVPSTQPVGTIVAPTATSVVAASSAVDLTSSGGVSGTGATTGTGTGTGTGAGAGGTGSGSGSATGSSTTAPITNPTSPSGAGLSFTVTGTGTTSLAAGRSISARVNVSRASQVTATLLNPAGKSVYTWRFRTSAGATAVRLIVPAKVKKPGLYTIVWRATSSGETVRRQIRVQLTAGKAAVPNACSKVVGVLVDGPKPGANVTGQLRSNTRLTVTTTQSLFSMIASTTRNVQVVVIDVDRLGIQPIRDLRLVFPNVRILALTANSSVQRQARQAGAMLALSPANAKLGSTIERLAHPQKACAAAAPKKAAAPKAKPLPKAAGVLQKSLNTVLAKRTIQFEAGKTVLTSSGRATLDRLLTTLKQYPKARIRIEGYTDSDGARGRESRAQSLPGGRRPPVPDQPRHPRREPDGGRFRREPAHRLERNGRRQGQEPAHRAQGHRRLASTASAAAMTINAPPIARRRTSSESRPVSLAPSQPPTSAAGTPAASNLHSTSSRAACAASPSDPNRAAHDQVRPHRLGCRHPDTAQEHGHAHGSEDHPDGTAERAGSEPARHRRGDAEPGARDSVKGAREEIDAVEEEDRRRNPKERLLGHVAPEVPADECTGDGRWQHPGDDRPRDATLARMAHRSRRGGRGADPEVRARSGARTGREQDDQRKPERTEDEAERRSQVPGDKRARRT